MVSNFKFATLERTKRNFSYDAPAATRPQLESVGGTDYIKPKGYGASQYKGQSHYSKPQSSSHLSQAKPKPHHSSSAQERGDASIPDEFKIPPEIAAAMDP